MTSVRLAMLVVALVLMRSPVSSVAQEPEGPLAALQTKQVLTDDDRAEIRVWIGQQIAGIADTDPVAAQGAFRRLRDGAQGTPAFKEAYVAASVEVIGSAYKKAQVMPAARLIAVLNALGDARSQGALLEALRDDRTAVRAAAAIGLRNLRPKLAADAASYARTLAALKEAGKKESSRQTLQLIYRAMDYADVTPTPDLSVCAVAVLELLEDRVKHYGGQTVPAEGAEVVALTRTAELRKALNETQSKRYALVLVKLLHYGVESYTGGERPLGQVRDKTSGPDVIALRNAVELLITKSEEQLTQMLSPEPAPGVAEAMRRAKKIERAGLADMILAMNKWAPVVKEKLGMELAPLNAPPPTPEGNP